MTENTVTTYEAFDGKEFDDFMECLSYETNELYQKSGIRFMTSETEVVDKIGSCPDDAYNEAEYIKIDRTKKEENFKFINYAIRDLGWSLFSDNDFMFGIGTMYRMERTRLVEIV